MLRIVCDKCHRRGSYNAAKLVKKYGLDAKLFEWSDEITADCPRKQANNFNDFCGARCPIYEGRIKAGLLRRSLWLQGTRDTHLKLPVNPSGKDVHRSAFGVVSRIGDELIVDGKVRRGR